MPAVMVTFVQTTYALVTFVQINNISATTGPILTKLSVPNFFWVIIFVDLVLVGPKVFRPEILLDPK